MNQRSTGLYWLNMMIVPRELKIIGALLAKYDDCAPWIKWRPECASAHSGLSILFSATIRNELAIALVQIASK